MVLRLLLGDLCASEACERSLCTLVRTRTRNAHVHETAGQVMRTKSASFY